jgi:aminocarboxymuconate-semialdehyde decarboxylase
MIMILDVHAHALDEAFLHDLCRTPRFGLAGGRDAAGRFCLRRGDAPPVSLDFDLIDMGKRLESLTRRDVRLQLIGPPPGLASWPGAPLMSIMRGRSTSTGRASLPREADGSS